MTSGPCGETVLERLCQHAETHPDSRAYQAGTGESLTYKVLSHRVTGLAAMLRGELEPGGVIILSCCNQLMYPIAFLGVLAAGHTVFPVPPEAADAELLRAAAVSKAIAAIGDARAIGLLEHCVRRVIPIDQLPAGSDRHATVPSGDLLLQSSGSTGLPKIVRRSGTSLDAVARATAEGVGFRPDDRVLMTVPLTHSYGIEHGILAPVWAGSCVQLCRGLDLSVIVPELCAGGITLFPGVPSTFEMLGNIPGTELKMASLRAAYSAGGALPRSVFDTFNARFGIRIGQLYGASEIGSATFNSGAPDSDPASVGRPFRGVSIRILHPDTNAPLPAGTEGQVAVRAESMFSGYLAEPADLIDGYFPTGDLGRLDSAGRLTITGRIKLLIDVGGLKVNALEVEAVLAEHPAVAACVVVAIEQSETVSRLKAIVTPRHPGAPPSAAELRRFAKCRLAAYKVPRVFEVRDSLPRSPAGKVLRHLVETA